MTKALVELSKETEVLLCVCQLVVISGDLYIRCVVLSVMLKACCYLSGSEAACGVDRHIIAQWNAPLLSGKHSMRCHGLSPSGCQCIYSVHLSIDIYCGSTSHPLWHSMQLQAPGRGRVACSWDKTSSQWTILLTFDLAACQEMKLNPCMPVVMLLCTSDMFSAKVAFSSKVQGY